MNRLAVVMAGLALTAGLGETASARPASTGWYTEGSLGGEFFLPKASKDADPGPVIDLHVGRDLFSWLSVGVMVAGSTHEATVPPPPTHQYFQLYRGAAEARIGGLLDRFGGFLEGGAGVAMISSNVLQQVGVTDAGEHFSIVFHAGAGVEYQLENRHYAVGLAADAFLIPQFDSIKVLDTRLYLRYTY